MPASVALFAEPVTTGHNREGTKPKINPAGRGMEKELAEPETTWLLGGTGELYPLIHQIKHRNNKVELLFLTYFHNLLGINFLGLGCCYRG